MGRKRKGRPVSGVLTFLKPEGMSSNHALQRVKRLFGAAKAGHTGSLDPLATGVLPICFGESTKFSQYLLDSNKRYLATIVLGVETDTYDRDGEVMSESDASHVSREDVEAALIPFRGSISQIPPMYSALKQGGQPLYKLARQGVEVERKARDVTIFACNIMGFASGRKPVLTLDVLCSKGTYIRSLAYDLGRALGCGGTIKDLHRTETGPFTESQGIDMSGVEALADEGADALDALLLPIDAPVAHLPSVALDDDSTYYFSQGNPIMDLKVYRNRLEGDIVRVFSADERFLGLGRLDGEGRIAPNRLVVYS